MPGTKITTEMYNELVDTVNGLLKLTVGAGLEMRQTSAGTCISLGTVGISPNYNSPYVTLAHTTGQDLDTWSASSMSVSGVMVPVFSQIVFDPSNGYIGWRYRNHRYDDNGLLLQVYGESDTENLAASGCGTVPVVTNVWFENGTLKQSKTNLVGLINNAGSGTTSDVFVGETCTY